VLEIHDVNRRIPFYHAVRNFASSNELLLKLIFDAYPAGAMVRDNEGMTPLHSAFEKAD
jgi:hypothetical protein